MPRESSESLQPLSPGPRKARRPAGGSPETPSIDHPHAWGSKHSREKSLHGSVLERKRKPSYHPCQLCREALPETPTLCPALEGLPGQGPTLRVSVSKRLEVVAEELLLLRGLGQGAVGYARHLGLG